MADFVDPCCVASTMAVQLTKPDKNNNTTANVDDGIILPSEQCDVIEDGLEEKSDSTGDSDDRHVSSGADEDGTSNSTPAAPSVSTTDVQPVSISSSYSNNPNNNSSNNTSTNTPMPTSNSDPYKDFSGVDTESFISTTLRNNPKDRLLLLRLEAVLQQFIQDGEKTSHQFQAMNSYERMIVHRVAAFFGLDHNVDKNGQAVVVTKTSNTRIPDFSFQKCIPEGESSDANPGAFAADASLASNSVVNSNPTDIPTRRILRRHEKTSNHEHSTRNGLNDEHSHLHSSSTPSNNKHSSTHKPYSERMNNYAETRARIFNETPNTTNMDGSNSTASNMNNRTQKSNGKGNAHFGRASYRKSQPNHHPNQQRSYLYPHAQTTTNNHLQAFATGKPIDPSSHLINPVAGRGPLYSSHQMGTPNLSMAQAASLYGPMVASNPNAGPIRMQVPGPFYPPGQQPPIDYDYKQTLAGAHIYNYVSMIPQPASNFLHPQSQAQQQQQPGQAQVPGQTQGLTSVTTNNPNQVPSQHGTSIQIPILLHQQPSGQIQYIFPAQALQQQQQAQQNAPPSSANPYPLTPDGQYVQVYRTDGLSITGAGPAVLENNPNHHHAHHHAYPPTPSYHHHPGPPHAAHPLSQPQQVPPQAQQSQQTQQPSQGTGPGASQSNLTTQPGSFLRLYSTGTPANLSHPYPQATYSTGAPHPPGSFVQPGTLPPGSYMIPPQTPGAVPPYPTFDNGTPYPTAYAQAPAPNNTGKNGMNNAQAPPPPSVQYATNHLSNLTLQANQHDDYQARLMSNNPNPRYTHPNGSSNNHIAATGTGGGGQPRNFIGRPLVQSPNGTSPTPRMTMYPPSNHPYRPARPYNLANTDKTMPSVNENDPKATPSNQPTTNTSESISLAGPAQE